MTGINPVTYELSASCFCFESYEKLNAKLNMYLYYFATAYYVVSENFVDYYKGLPAIIFVNVYYCFTTRTHQSTFT